MWVGSQTQCTQFIQIQKGMDQLDKYHINQSSRTGDGINYNSERRPPTKNTFLFGILVILMQLDICLIYGFGVVVPDRTLDNATNFPTSLAPVFITFAFFMMVLLGFGLLFAYERRLMWSAMGFNFLITCLTIEWFFLVNLFWTKSNILKAGKFFSDQPNSNKIFLWSGGPNSEEVGIDNFVTNGATLVQAIKCSLANCIAFSAILGRAGPLEAFFIALFGTIGYELNRNLVDLIHFDFGDCYTIFIYGGFMGLMASWLLSCKQKKEDKNTKDHPKYTGSFASVTVSLLGALFLFAFFPIIQSDPDIGIERDIFPQIFLIGPISIWYSMASAVLMGTAFSILVNGQLVARDFINSLVAGGIASCTASLYFTNPVWSMVLGASAGMFQAIFQGTLEKKFAQSKNIINTHSFILFGFQGILGASFASIFRKVVEIRTDGFTYTPADLESKVAGFDLAVGALSAGMGLGFGLIVGLLILICAKHESIDHFEDHTYWLSDDGIRYPNNPNAQTPNDIFIKEAHSNVKSKHAYL